jgi:hypothetical protein
MNLILSRITPGQVSWYAKIASLLIAFALTAGYVTDGLTVETAGIGGFFLSLTVLMALPRQRSSELLGALAVWLTYAEFMAAAQSGHFDLWRWGVALATLSLVVVPLKVQHVRQLARTNPYQPIRELDRRVWPSTGPNVAPAPYAPAALAAICDAGLVIEAEPLAGAS